MRQALAEFERENERERVSYPLCECVGRCSRHRSHSDADQKRRKQLNKKVSISEEFVGADITEGSSSASSKSLSPHRLTCQCPCFTTVLSSPSPVSSKPSLSISRLTLRSLPLSAVSPADDAQKDFIAYYQHNRRMQCDLAIDLSEQSFSVSFRQYFQVSPFSAVRVCGD